MNQTARFRSTTGLLLLISFLLLYGQATAQISSSARGQGTVTAKNERGQTIELYSGSYALILGVSRYTGGWRQLPGVKEDVRAVGDALRGQGFQVTTVNDPTRASMLEALDDFIDRYGEQRGNRLLIYFAGHGETLTTPDGRQLGYLVPADAPLSRNQPAFKRAAVNVQTIEEYAQRIVAKHVLFVFDSCFSGMLFNALRRGGPPPFITLKAADPVRQFITAGTAAQEVPDHSVFREAFIRGMNGEADRQPTDGYVTGTELGEYLQSEVTNYSKNTQTPQYGKIKQEKLDQGDFIFLVPNGKPARLATNPPPLSQQTPEKNTRPRPGATDLPSQTRPSKPPTITAESNFFHFELKSCRISAPTIICDFLITNREAGRYFGVITGPFVNATRLWDNLGNVYYSSDAKLANQQYGGQLNTDVPTPLRVTFKGEGTQGSTKISQLEMIFRFGQNDSSTIQFKNICLTDNCSDAPGNQGTSRGQREFQSGDASRGSGNQRNFSMPANQQWFDTGIDVEPGMRLQIEASGTIQLGGGRQSGPNGMPGVGAANLLFPVKSAFMGTLIAKTRSSNGKDSKKVAIGARNTLVIEENEYGRLFLGINDSPVSDNQGSYTVNIKW